VRELPRMIDSPSESKRAVEQLWRGFEHLPSFEPYDRDGEAQEAVLAAVAQRLGDNYPYFHPLYAGQMLKPPHPVARQAYALAMRINPNNHALDGGRASSAMEREAVAQIAAMFAWPQHLGHLCGGGTMANLEALWVAGRTHPGKHIVASDQAHYTHARISEVLQLPFAPVRSDDRGRMDLESLRAELKRREVGTVVATIGTTATGSVDPLHEIVALQREFGFRVHADAAYGGYFGLAATIAPEVKAAYAALRHVDSLVVDPHKHGLQAYGCGCVLFRDPSVGAFYKHESPYTYFSSKELHLGEISLECSRAGAAAVALWATQRLLPLEAGGAFGQRLDRSLEAARRLHAALSRDERFVCVFAPQLDIVVWTLRASSASEASRLARERLEAAERNGLYLALAELPARFFARSAPHMKRDRETVTCLRSVLMKPEHLDWIDSIVELLCRR
jgi:tyrosine decarboxylase/aspartate 1-decarboxylase